MSLKFQKKKEDFICAHCGTKIKGNGFTNHCPYCLWSKHVDDYPGDREAGCGGMMEPTDTEESGGEWSIIYRCQKCGKIHKNKLSITDSFDRLIQINKDKN